MGKFETIITILAGLITTFIGGGWFQRRKARAEASRIETENKTTEGDYANKIIQTWEKGFEDLKQIYTVKYDALFEQYTEIKKLYNDTRAELDKLKDVVEQNTNMQLEIEKLQKKVKILECENKELKKEVEKLKQ
jgi:RNAse (barnase) inhibitor barstar